MLLEICDRCGKQVDRFVNPNPATYQIYMSHDGERASWVRPMKFCPECEGYLSAMIERELKHKPKTVTLDTNENWHV